MRFALSDGRSEYTQAGVARGDRIFGVGTVYRLVLNIEPRRKGLRVLVSSLERDHFLPLARRKITTEVRQKCWFRRLRSCRRASLLVSPNVNHRRCKASWVRADPMRQILSGNQITTKSEDEPFSIRASLFCHMSHKPSARSMELVSWSGTHRDR